jgi:hypothetical protein
MKYLVLSSKLMPMKKPIAALSLVLILSLLPSNLANAATKEPKQITGFQDAIDRAQDVSYWAWKKSSIQISSNKSKSPPVKLIVGPNTKLSNPKPKDAFDGISRLYPEFRRPNKIYVVYFSHKDVAWAQTEYKSIHPDASGQEAKNFCPKIESCEGAGATINRSGDGVILMFCALLVLWRLTSTRMFYKLGLSLELPIKSKPLWASKHLHLGGL